MSKSAKNSPSVLSLPWRPSWDYWIIGLVVLALYLPTLRYDLVWDDLMLVRDNQLLRPVNAHRILTSQFWQTSPTGPPLVTIGYVRPLVIGGFFIERQLFGSKAQWPYHATNVLLYLFSVFLVLALLRLWLRERSWAMVGALLFAVHPIHIEGVTFVTGRTDLLSSLFLLVAAWLWSRPLERWTFATRAGVSLSFALALLTKENALFLPLWLVAIDFLHHRMTWRETWRRHRTDYLLMVAVAALYFGYRYQVLGYWLNPPAQHYPLGRKLFLLPYTLGHYLQFTLLPYWHSIYITFAQLEVGFTPALIFSLVMLFGLAGLLAWFRREIRVWLGLATWLVFILPVINLPGLSIAYIAMGILFLPVLGGILLILPALERVVRYNHTLGWGLILLLILSWGIDTAVRNPTWKDNPSLFSEVLRESPKNVSIWGNLCEVHLRDKNYTAAEQAWSQMAKLAPNDSSTYRIQGKLLVAEGRIAEGVQAYYQGLKVAPNSSTFLGLLATAYSDPPVPDSVIHYAQEMLRLDSLSAAGWNSLGFGLLLLGRAQDARPFLEKAQTIDPGDPEIQTNLGWDLALFNMYPQAESLLRSAIEGDPKAVNARVNLCQVYLQLNQLDAAKALADELLSLASSNPRTHGLMGNILAAQGHMPEAIESYKRCRELDPTLPTPLLYLLSAYSNPPEPDSLVRYGQELTHLSPQTSEGWTGLGYGLALKGQTVEGIDDLRHALALNPANFDALAYLVQACRQSGQLNLARQAAHDWIQANPTHPRTPEVQQMVI